MKLHIDFETRSAADLKRTGVHKYAVHPTTDILCVGFAFDHEEPLVLPIAHAGPIPMIWIRALKHIREGGTVVAHNAAFELAIWNSVGCRKYGWPGLKIGQLDCTMARAYAMSLPGSLEKCSAAVGIGQEKDMKGHRLMMKMSQPKSRPSIPGAIEWHETSEELERLYAYCKQDVVVEQLLDKRLLSLSKKEKKIWEFDQRVNWRGIPVDVVNSKKAIAVVDAEQDRLNLEMRRASNNTIASCNAHIQVRAFLKSRGIETEGVGKNVVIELLARPDLPDDVRRVLSIRQEAAKSSTAKLESIVDGASSDGRVRGVYQYHGAGTGRWAGRRLQTQNFPRPSIKQREIEEIFDVLANQRDPGGYISAFHGAPISVLSNCLRGFIKASPGKDLIAMDYSAIEARVVAWLAGQESVLEIFRGHGKIYEYAASQIFGVPISEVTKEQRSVGKVAILALGYQGGVGALQAMATASRIALAPALPILWASADADRKDRALVRWNDKRVAKHDLLKEEWLASELIKLAWRDENQEIVQYWADVEIAAVDAVREPGVVFDAGSLGREVSYLKKGSFLFCRLPSGRCLTYPYPRINESKTPWGSKASMLVYKGEDAFTRKWGEMKAYGGMLVENITQAVARDVLAEALLRCESRGYPVVMHVHDEVVSEIDKNFGSLDEFAAIVAELPEWAADLPIATEGWRGERYRK